MKERGLTFCQELVPKVMDGSKFVTRRLGGLKEINEDPGDWVITGREGDAWAFMNSDLNLRDPIRRLINSRQGVAGDGFYMQEAWGLLYPTHKPFNGDAALMRAWQAGVEESRDFHHSLAPLIPVYKADHLTGNDGPEKVRWRSGRFQPKWACRPQRWELVSVRPERVQKIALEDIIAEGYCDPQLVNLPAEAAYAYRVSSTFAINARAWWREVWNTINAKRGYACEKNPWVWREEWNPKPVVGSV